MSRPKVSTRTENKSEKVEKILGILRNFPEGATPKIIAFYTGINVNTVKTILPEINSVRKKGYAGLYHIVGENRDGRLFDWKFHNCILSLNLKDYTGQKIKENHEIGLIKLNFGIGAKSKKATLRVAAEHPLNISAICLALAHFKELILNHTKLKPKIEETIISSIELNQDFKNLRLDGIKCLTLDSLISQFKIYEKKNVVRVEHKLTIPITPEIIFSMLEGNYDSLDMFNQLSDMKNQIKNMEGYLRNNNALMKKLLEKSDFKNDFLRMLKNKNVKR